MSTPHHDLFDDIVAMAESKGVKIRYKDESLFMKVLNWVPLFFVIGFMETFTTTIGSTVYFPSREYVRSHPLSATVVLCHELVHVEDSKRMGFWTFAALYLFPHCLTIPAGLAVACGVAKYGLWWSALVMVAALLPYPSPGRTMLELRGYGMTLAASRVIWPRNPFHGSSIVPHFHGPAYYFMGWYKSRAQLSYELNQLRVQGDVGTLEVRIPVWREIKRILDRNGPY